MKMSKLCPISHCPSSGPTDLLVLQGQVQIGSRVLNVVLLLSHTLILVTGSSTWDLMAKNSEDLNKSMGRPAQNSQKNNHICQEKREMKYRSKPSRLRSARKKESGLQNP
ncbi:hypothetical protein ILYODFUR_033483 [Ilyodon furcidens]|uniref:Uncharacterized protein n=1 Tax=Ilyodon furcidens TaxID=33524 RepID=A0ABV0UL54_9TELE